MATSPFVPSNPNQSTPPPKPSSTPATSSPTLQPTKEQVASGKAQGTAPINATTGKAQVYDIRTGQYKDTQYENINITANRYGFSTKGSSSSSQSSGGGGASPTQSPSSTPPPSSSQSPFVQQLPASRVSPILDQKSFENKGTLLSSQELPQVLQSRRVISAIERNIPTSSQTSNINIFMQQYGNVERTAQTLVNQRNSQQASFAQTETQALYNALTLPKTKFSSLITGRSYDVSTPTIAAKLLLASSPRLAASFVNAPRYAFENAYLEGQALAGSKVQRTEAIRQATTTQPAGFFESFVPLKTSTPFRKGGDISFNPSGAIGLGTAILGGFEASSAIPSRITNPLKGISGDINLEMTGQLSPSGKALTPEVKLSYSQQSPTLSGFFGRQAQTELTISTDGAISKVSRVGKTTYTYEQSAGAQKGTLTTTEANKILSQKNLNAIDLVSQQTSKLSRSSLFIEDAQITRQGQDIFAQQTSTGKIPLRINQFTGQAELQFSTEKTFAGSSQTVSGGAYYGQSTLKTQSNFLSLAKNTAKELKTFSEDISNSLTPSRLISSKRGSLSLTQDATQTGGYGGTMFDTDFAGRFRTTPPTSFSPESPVILRNLNKISSIPQEAISINAPSGTISLRLPSSKIGSNNIFSAFGSMLPKSIPSAQAIVSSIPSSSTNPFISPFAFDYSKIGSGANPIPQSIIQPQTDVNPIPQSIPNSLVQPATQLKTESQPITYPEFTYPRFKTPEIPLGDNIPFFDIPNPIGSPGQRRQPKGKRKKFKGIYTKDITSFIFGDVIRAQKLPKLSRKSLGVVSGLGVRY